MTVLWLVMNAPALAISGYDETEFMTVEAFLSQVYGEPLPGISLLPLRGDLRDQVETALGHRYRGLRLRYWQQADVTTGITHLNVLVYREPRAGKCIRRFPVSNLSGSPCRIISACPVRWMVIPAPPCRWMLSAAWQPWPCCSINTS